jgi:hypothetical protein
VVDAGLQVALGVVGDCALEPLFGFFGLLGGSEAIADRVKGGAQLCPRLA